MVFNSKFFFSYLIVVLLIYLYISLNSAALHLAQNFLRMRRLALKRITQQIQGGINVFY